MLVYRLLVPRLASALRAHRTWVAAAAVAVAGVTGFVRDAIHVTGQVSAAELVCMGVALAAGVLALWSMLSLGLERRHREV